MINFFGSSDDCFMFMDEHILEAVPGLIYIETSPQEVYSRLFKIERDLKLNFSFNAITNDLYELICRIPIPLIEIDLNFVIRCRPNYEEGGKKYSTVSELSYNPNCGRILKGRFNIEKEAVFYGTLPTKSKGGNCSMTAILEANKNILNDGNINCNNYVTLSRWNIKNKFLAINLSTFKDAEIQNLSINELSKSLVEQTSRKFTVSSFKSFWLLSKYMARKAATQISTDNGYLITTALKKAIKKFYKKNVNAVIFPSFTSEFNELNIAIDKILVDKNFIEFDGAVVYKILSHPYEFKRQLFPCSNYARPDCYGNYQLNIK